MTGYRITYRPDHINHCPGCGRSHWYVGRITAECGFCGTAIPLQDAVVSPPKPRTPKLEVVREKRKAAA
jgi:hypothetical protein